MSVVPYIARGAGGAIIEYASGDVVLPPAFAALASVANQIYGVQENLRSTILSYVGRPPHGHGGGGHHWTGQGAPGTQNTEIVSYAPGQPAVQQTQAGASYRFDDNKTGTMSSGVTPKKRYKREERITPAKGPPRGGRTHRVRRQWLSNTVWKASKKRTKKYKYPDNIVANY